MTHPSLTVKPGVATAVCLKPDGQRCQTAWCRYRNVLDEMITDRRARGYRVLYIVRYTGLKPPPAPPQGSQS